MVWLGLIKSRVLQNYMEIISKKKRRSFNFHLRVTIIYFDSFTVYRSFIKILLLASFAIVLFWEKTMVSIYFNLTTCQEKWKVIIRKLPFIKEK